MIRRRTKATKNPANERLRIEGGEERDIRDVLPTLKEKTKRIHVGWLFNTKGTQALKDLCLALDSTPNSHSCSGWKDLAYHLQLDSRKIGCIQNRKFLGETETYYTLTATAQYPERTLDQLLEALEKIGRFDALQQTWESINCLATEILDDEILNHSLPPEDIIKPPQFPRPPAVVLEGDIVHCNGVPTSQNDIQELIQKMFKLLIQPAAIEQKTEVYRTPKVTSNILVSEACPASSISPTDVKNNVKNIKYDCIVMLTFARDGEKYIPDIAESLRQERQNGQRIGVLILEEHSAKVEMNPQQFIMNVFSQVNYVVPVITEGYLKSVVDISPEIYPSAEDYIDTKWTRYIYTLMNSDYIKKGCLNTKIRCLVPDEVLHLTQRHRRMREPIFETWNKISDIDKVGNRLLSNTKRCKLLSSEVKKKVLTPVKE